MKKILLYFSTLIYSISIVQAQTTFTAADYAQIGDSFLYSSRTTGMGLDFDTTGANMVWDYSSLAPKEQRQEFFIDPTNSGYQTQWCLQNNFVFNCNAKFADLTNLAYRSRDTLNISGVSAENQVDHYRNMGDVLEATMLGFTSTASNIPLPFSFEYDRPDTILRFPIMYGDVDSSDSYLTLDFSPLPVSQIRNHKRKNTVTGWGQLITPYGTFNNTLKMTTIIEKYDTVNIASGLIPTLITQYQHKWFDPSNGFPVLRVTGTIVGSLRTVDKIEYLDHLRCVDPHALFAYQPSLPIINPATDSALVSFSNLSSGVDSLIWDFGDGHTSTDYAPFHSYGCTGTYTVQLTVYNSCDTGTAIDTFSLPLFVNDPFQTFDTSTVDICYGESYTVGNKDRFLPGYYTETYPQTTGCDSSAIVHLNVKVVNTNVKIKDGTLHATNLDGDSYQWLSCPNMLPIVNATDSLYVPPSSGRYAVVIEQDGCTDTSLCNFFIFTSVDDLYQSDLFRIYPNPTKQNVNIDLLSSVKDAEYYIYSVWGQLIRHADLRQKNNRISLVTLPSGSYFIRVHNDGMWTSENIILTE